MMSTAPRRTGWIEVICGSMFSGKTEELIRRLRLARIARQRVVIFKPNVDDRYAEDAIVSHDARRVESILARSPWEIYEKARGYDVVGVDEGQFFGLALVEVAERLADEGARVLVAGLDQDFRGVPFEPMPQLLAVAEHISKNLAVCVQCGAPANRSQRLVERQTRVVVGAGETYEARCRRCFEPPSDGEQGVLPLAPLTHVEIAERMQAGSGRASTSSGPDSEAV